jgi:hypothetical protein
LGKLGSEGKIILKWILYKYGMRMRTGFIWLRIGTIRHFRKMRGDVNEVEQGEVLLLLPNLVPHPVSFNITVLVSSKNEIAIILFFATITICSVILISTYYINNVNCYSYR